MPKSLSFLLAHVALSTKDRKPVLGKIKTYKGTGHIAPDGWNCTEGQKGFMMRKIFKASLCVDVDVGFDLAPLRAQQSGGVKVFL